jgi:ketosteroid isomerase-like protein
MELARRGFEAFVQGGPDAVVDLWHPEIELLVPSGLIQSGGVYRGPEAILAWMKEFEDAWDEIEYKAEEFTDAGEGAVITVLYDGRGKGSGVRTQGRYWYLFKFRDGRLKRWELYPERMQALEAAGLSE